MATKAELRRELRARVAALSPAEKLRQSAALCERLLKDPELESVKILGVYLALPDEPDLSPALPVFLDRGVRLALPVPDPDGAWRFRDIPDLTPHSSGPWGLSLPAPGEAVDASELDAVLVPGRGFTADGHRIGRGKGIYDRLLAGASARTIGLGFSCQLVEDLPREPHDILLREILIAQK